MSDQRNPWHLNKTVTIGVILGLATQIFSIIGIYFSMQNRIDKLELWQIETNSNRFTAQDAELIQYKVSENQKHSTAFDAKLDRLIEDMVAVKAALNIPSHGKIAVATKNTSNLFENGTIQTVGS